MKETALLTFSIGPVHTFIGQARRIADLWAGSAILSDLMSAAVQRLLSSPRCELVFPAVKDAGQIPDILPNRFVARVPATSASDVARGLEAEVQTAWKAIIEHGIRQLTHVEIDVSLKATEAVWSNAITCSWSWLAEEDDYAASSRAAAELFAATRLFRPFKQEGDAGMKCAVCGERNALPDGRRDHVVAAWANAETAAAKQNLGAFVRGRQTRLCVVCAGKRFYPLLAREGRDDRSAYFKSFQDFQPEEAPNAAGEQAQGIPYFALVTMDGDQLGKALSGAGLSGPDLAGRQERISTRLKEFAEALHRPGSAELRLDLLGLKDKLAGRLPQLIYAGGDDVLFVSDPRDALPVAAAVRNFYVSLLADESSPGEPLTISAAIVFAHTKVPAGTLLHDADRLLNEKAKDESGRNSVAISLQKKGGVPVETVFRWDDPEAWIEKLADLTESLSNRELASRQTYALRDDERVLRDVFKDKEEWLTWLKWRMSKGELSAALAEALAEQLTPFLLHGKPEALRIARFLGIEAGRDTRAGGGR